MATWDKFSDLRYFIHEWEQWPLGRNPEALIFGEKGAEMKTEGQSSLLLGREQGKIVTNWEQNSLSPPFPGARNIICIRSRSFNLTPCKKIMNVCDYLGD